MSILFGGTKIAFSCRRANIPVCICEKVDWDPKKG